MYLRVSPFKPEYPQAKVSHMNSQGLTHDASLSSSPSHVRIIMNKEMFKSDFIQITFQSFWHWWPGMVMCTDLTYL